ncbi:DUF4436 family protein [Kitasatospora sp. NBC_01300]|uniref:DUF4436 family protein n=1 Tax=Kitasatospora sp. NBC_01300 TaxID=2903574 RepID=UPI002F90B788|nr:DUF4436 domain-containing protein [Kitasatospora sp. NBC_01300]
MQVTTDDSSATSPVAHRAPRHRWRFALVLAMVVALCGGGIGLYLNERNTREQTRELAIPTAQDWIELDITAQDVDPAAQQLTLYVTPVPHGRLAAGADGQAFSRPVEITVTGTPRTTIRAAEGETAAPQLVHVGMYDGTITDYPFDRYRMEAGFTATSGATPVPVGLVVTDTDPFFVLRPQVTAGATGTVALDAKITRSRSTFILAWFMIAAMWAIALAVLGAAEVLYRKREGLVWPSLGWMAASLFALIGMRNAAPGSPPIGSLIDYLAFFWAEGIIAASLACTAWCGIRTEHRQRREREAAADQP